MARVILCRAQPFHNGHLAMIRKALRETYMETGRHEKLFVFIGSADKQRTKRNPFSIEERMELVVESLKEELYEEEYASLELVPLQDLSSEEDNSFSWGCYLYEQIVEATGEDRVTFYYADTPSIPLSWFNPALREKISFRFLDRLPAGGVECVSATIVRALIRNENFLLRGCVPKAVYDRREELKEILDEVEVLGN